MLRRARARLPVELALALHDRHVVDTCEAQPHQPRRVELPILVAIGSVPASGLVAPFTGEAHRDSVFGERPQLLDEPIVALACPFAREEADALARGAFVTPGGTLTISASTQFGRIYVLPILIEYLDLHPGVSVRALLVDRVTNMIEEGVDVAVRLGHLPPSSLSAVRVGAMRRIVCGAPDYFRRQGMPQVPGDVRAHRIVGATETWNSLDWHFGGDKPITVRVNPRLLCNTNDAAIEAAVQGWGLTRVLSYQVAALVEQGKLVPVLTDYEEEPWPIHIVHPEGRRVTAKVRAFVQLATERLRANPQINPG